MSDEPRIRLEDSGTVVSEYWYDQSTGETVVESESGETYRFANDGTLDTPALNTDEASVESADVTGRLSAQGVDGSIAPSGRMTFSTEFIGETPWSNTDAYDPIIIHRRHFDDGQYRVMWFDTGVPEWNLEKTPDFETWTTVETGLYPEFDSGDSFQDHVILPDGRFALYWTDNSDFTTHVWTGTDLTNLTDQGEVCPSPDCGVFLEDGTVHIYPEGSSWDNTATSQVLEHWTTPVDDLTNATQQSDALDLSGEGWGTGDPDIIKVGNFYYMFTDRFEGTLPYHIALCQSMDLYNWTVVNGNITSEVEGGDMVVTRRGGHFEGLTEYTGSDYAGIGHWRLYPAPATDKIQYPGQFELYDETKNAVRLTSTENQFDEHYLDMPPKPSGGTTGLRLVDASGDGVGAFANFNGDTYIDGYSGTNVNIGIKASGQTEMIVSDGSVSFNKFINMAPQSSTPSSPSTNDIYLDDGTNTGDGNEGFRRYDGTSWVDIG